MKSTGTNERKVVNPERALWAEAVTLAMWDATRGVTQDIAR